MSHCHIRGVLCRIVLQVIDTSLVSLKHMLMGMSLSDV